MFTSRWDSFNRYVFTFPHYPWSSLTSMLSILAPVGTCEGFLTNVPCRVWEQSNDVSPRTPDGVGITPCLELLRPSDPHAVFLFFAMEYNLSWQLCFGELVATVLFSHKDNNYKLTLTAFISISFTYQYSYRYSMPFSTSWGETATKLRAFIFLIFIERECLFHSY